MALSKQGERRRRFEYGVTDFMRLESGRERRKVNTYKVYVTHKPSKREDQPW